MLGNMEQLAERLEETDISSGHPADNPVFQLLEEEQKICNIVMSELVCQARS